MNQRFNSSNNGFTLIELSIVLVIIGLIVGGVLVGRDLINAAEVRAQISQIEKLQTAVATFKGKFGELPGDISYANAVRFGFVTTGCTDAITGMRDGNGDFSIDATFPVIDRREPALFWEDLSGDVGGRLIEGTYPNNTTATINCNNSPSTFTSTPGTYFIGNFIPAAKIGQGNYIYIYSSGGTNWFNVSHVTGTN